MSGEKKKVKLFRPVLALVIGLLIMLISFGTYMVHTSLEDVLEKEYGAPIVTHDLSSSQE
ncbi:hypothetical protein [uncultured Ruminococcus sp.]|uniref:hypothetical protein n=1 Tax=uncultured Ruminococcus sp. TaxID=165186 RepID=UPI000ECF071C|nr:hypothetical protein [uncultured Ruminococcus sp.]HCJ41965.1 hypothetical protein [Ruminococcus sp.]